MLTAFHFASIRPKLQIGIGEGPPLFSTWRRGFLNHHSGLSSKFASVLDRQRALPNKPGPIETISKSYRCSFGSTNPTLIIYAPSHTRTMPARGLQRPVYNLALVREWGEFLRTRQIPCMDMDKGAGDIVSPGIRADFFNTSRYSTYVFNQQSHTPERNEEGAHYAVFSDFTHPLDNALALLDHRQARFVQCLHAKPQDGEGPEEILEHRSSDLMARIRRKCGSGRGETAEVQRWEEFRELRARVFVENKEDALRTARDWTDQENTVWTDGSRLENGAVEATVVFTEEGVWKRKGIYLSRNKEVFDAEIFAIRQALELLDNRNERDTHYTVFSDSQVGICRVQHNRTGLGQVQAVVAITTSEAIISRNNIITLPWTPSHAGVAGNEQADDMAKRAAEEREERASPLYLREVSLSHLSRVTTKAR